MLRGKTGRTKSVRGGPQTYDNQERQWKKDQGKHNDRGLNTTHGVSSTQIGQGNKFGKQQSAIAKTVGATQKSYAKTKGPNKPSVSSNAQRNNPGKQRAQLPNLDDINSEFNNRDINGEDDRRRFVDYNEQYATTGVKNKLKDKYKRGKKSKKGTSIFGTLEGNQTGNSVLDSYRSLGNQLRRG